jgi:hypothetical protein
VQTGGRVTDWRNVRTATEKLFLAEFGVSINVIPDVLAVHFPFLLTRDVQNNVEFLTENYWQRIRFTFNIMEVKPRERLQGLFR